MTDIIKITSVSELPSTIVYFGYQAETLQQCLKEFEKRFNYEPKKVWVIDLPESKRGTRQVQAYCLIKTNEC